MSLTQTASDVALMSCNVHRLATLWTLTRTDGEIFRLTDHNAPIEFDDETFTPMGGFDVTAMEKQDSLGTANLELTGVLATSAITFDDIRAGKYRDAELLEQIVDWMYPWNGAFVTNKYWIGEVTASGEHWEARVEGLGRWLEPQKGALFSRPCRYVLGSDECTIDLTSATYYEEGVVSSISTARRIFLATGLTKATDYFNDGRLVWLTGSNTGLISEVKDYLSGPITVELHLPTPFNIQGGDTFRIYAGCDKLAATCLSKFSNLDNYGGFPYIPGTDKTMQTPLSK